MDVLTSDTAERVLEVNFVWLRLWEMQPRVFMRQRLQCDYLPEVP